MSHSGNGPQFEYAWIRVKRNSGSVQAAIELIGEERAKDLAAIWWRYGVSHEQGHLLLNPESHQKHPMPEHTCKAQVEMPTSYTYRGSSFIFVRFVFDGRASGTLMLSPEVWESLRWFLKREFRYSEEEIVVSSSRATPEVRAVE